MKHSPYIYAGLRLVNQESIKEIVHLIYMIDTDTDFLKQGRKHPYIFASQTYVWALTEYLKYKPAQVAEVVGCHRTNVYHSLKQIQMYRCDKYVSLFIDKVKEVIDELKEKGQTSLLTDSYIVNPESIEALKIIST